jgi:ketosteroid isomerase-like protein
MLAILNVAASTAGAHGRGNASAVDEIKAMIAEYADVVNREPVDLALAASLWADSPDDTLIFPLGEFRGWEHIKQAFYQGIMEGRFSQRTLAPRDIQVHAYGDCAWAEFTWRFVAKSRTDGSKVETNGRETQIYRRLAPHRWALVHVHYSSLSAAERSSASSERQGALDRLAAQHGNPGVGNESPEFAAQTSSQGAARSQQTAGQHDRNALSSQSEPWDQRRGQLREFASSLKDDLAGYGVTFSFRFDDHGSQRRDLLRPEVQPYDLGNVGESQAAAEVPPEPRVGAGAVQVAKRGSNGMAPEGVCGTFVGEGGAPSARAQDVAAAASSAGDRSCACDDDDARRAAQSGLQSDSRIGGEEMTLRWNIFPQPRQKRTGDLQPVGAGESDASRANPDLACRCQGRSRRGKNLALGPSEPNFHRVGGSSSGFAEDVSAFVRDPGRGCCAAAINADIRVHKWHYTCPRIGEVHTLIDGGARDSI